MMTLMSPGLIFNTQEMEKKGLLIPKSFHMKSGINGKTEYKTTSRQGKKVAVYPYLNSPKMIHQVPKTVKRGM